MQEASEPGPACSRNSQRSRSLSMIVESQAKAGDANVAARTMSAIRDYPGIEKRRALGSLALWYEKAGDQATANTFLRQGLKLMEANPPQNALARLDKVKPRRSFTSRSFVDFRGRARLGEVEHEALGDDFAISPWRAGKSPSHMRSLPEGMVAAASWEIWQATSPGAATWQGRSSSRRALRRPTSACWLTT